MLLLGQGVRRLIDHGFAGGSPDGLNGAALLMFVVVAALAGATTLRFYLVSWLGERVAADLRRAAFDRLITLSPAFYETARTGELLSRLTADTSLLQSLVGSAISQWLRGVMILIGALAMLIATSPKLTLDRARRDPAGGRCRWCCSAGARSAPRAPPRTAWPISAPMPRRR